MANCKKCEHELRLPEEPFGIGSRLELEQLPERNQLVATCESCGTQHTRNAEGEWVLRRPHEDESD